MNSFFCVSPWAPKVELETTISNKMTEQKMTDIRSKVENISLDNFTFRDWFLFGPKKFILLIKELEDNKTAYFWLKVFNLDLTIWEPVPKSPQFSAHPNL